MSLSGLILWLSWITIANCGCIVSDVSMQFRHEIVPNNSYVLFSRIQQYSEGRLYCNTSSPDCCDTTADWYLPNGERVLGGYEYSNATNKFARSRHQSSRSVGLYRIYNPPERGRFWCELPDTNGTNCTLFVNIVNDVPAIIGQPISQAAVTEENVTFSVNVSNSDFSAYQWQKNNTSINNDDLGKYHGTRSPSLTIINAQEEDESYYRCVIDNYLVSDSAELTVGELISKTVYYYCINLA